MRASWFLLAVALPALAAEPSKTKIDCTLEHRDPDDVVARGHDVVIEPGQKVKDVLVVDGSVRLKKGAVVKTLFVSNGTATVEQGATVEGAVLVVHGRAVVIDRADVKKGVLTLDDGLHIEGQKGESFDLNLRIDGQSLGQKLASEIVKDMRGCKLVVD